MQSMGRHIQWSNLIFLLTKLHPLLHCCVNGLLRYSIQEISEIISFTELLLFLCRLEAKVSFVAIV